MYNEWNNYSYLSFDFRGLVIPQGGKFSSDIKLGDVRHDNPVVLEVLRFLKTKKGLMSSFDVTQINPNERNYDDTWSTVPQLSGSLKINNIPSVSITIDDVLFIFNQLGLVQSNKFIIDKHVFDLRATYDIWKYHKYNHDSERVYNYWVFEIENCKYNISNLIDKKNQQNRNSITSEDAVVYNLLLSYCNGRSRGLDFDYYPTGNNAHFDLYDGYSGDLTFKVEVHPDLKPTTVDAQHFLELIGFDLADSNVVMMSTKSKIYRSPVHEEEFPGKV